MGRIGTTMSVSDSDTGWNNTKLKRNNQVLSSSLECNPPARTKLDKKNEKKYKIQLIASLVTSMGVFLMVMFTIVSLPTSQPSNSSRATSLMTVKYTTIISSIISYQNYEELANPKDIIVEIQKSVEHEKAYDLTDRSSKENTRNGTSSNNVVEIGSIRTIRGNTVETKAIPLPFKFG